MDRVNRIRNLLIEILELEHTMSDIRQERYPVPTDDKHTIRRVRAEEVGWALLDAVLHGILAEELSFPQEYVFSAYRKKQESQDG